MIRCSMPTNSTIAVGVAPLETVGPTRRGDPCSGMTIHPGRSCHACTVRVTTAGPPLRFHPAIIVAGTDTPVGVATPPANPGRLGVEGRDVGDVVAG